MYQAAAIVATLNTPHRRQTTCTVQNLAPPGPKDPLGPKDLLEPLGTHPQGSPFRQLDIMKCQKKGCQKENFDPMRSTKSAMV